MNELLYFRDIDVLAYVEYDTTNSVNMFSYTTSREITVAERMAIEKILLHGYAPDKTSYYADVPSSFSYLGFDPSTKIKWQDYKRNIKDAEDPIHDSPEDSRMNQILNKWKSESSKPMN